MESDRIRKCPQIRLPCGIMNKAAIALQCKSNVDLIAAFLFIPYSYPIWGECLEYCVRELYNDIQMKYSKNLQIAMS